MQTLHENKSAIADPGWVEDQLDTFGTDDSDVRLVEVDMEPDAYDDGHIPGAVHIDWEADLAGELGGELVDREEFERLVGELGITEETTVVLYGDKANWFAAHAYWVFSYYGHEDVKLMDGGRHYWFWEDLPTTTEEPSYTTREYTASEPDESIRAYRDGVMEAVESEAPIVDVRNPQEYRGESPPADIPDTTEREGHIPDAENIPWGEAVNADGTFKSEVELRDIYGDVADPDNSTVTYCRIGERSSLTWFALNELLDIDAANYDGSWTEWANSDGAPVERGESEEKPVADGGAGQ